MQGWLDAIAKVALYVALTVGATVLLVCAVLFYEIFRPLIWSSEETRIWNELKAISEAKPGHRPFAGVEFVCFGFFSHDELAQEGKRLKQDFFAREYCGQRNTCCPTDGNQMMTAMKKDGPISCQPTLYLFYIPAAGRGFCTRPESLTVGERVYASPDTRPPAWRFSTFGAQYFEVGEKAQ